MKKQTVKKVVETLLEVLSFLTEVLKLFQEKKK